MSRFWHEIPTDAELDGGDPDARDPDADAEAAPDSLETGERVADTFHAILNSQIGKLYVTNKRLLFLQKKYASFVYQHPYYRIV